MQTLRFANGLVAHIKRTDFQPNQALVSAHFGFGLQSEPAPGAALLAPHLVRESGTGALNRDQLREALAGTTATLEFFVGPESFSFTGSGLSSELELLLQLLHARLNDPGFRPEAFAQARDLLGQMYAQMGASVEGVQQLAGERFLSGGSRFYTMPTREQVEALTLEQVADWLRPVFATAPLEISIVGDVDPEQARHLLDRYFGGDKRAIGARPTERPVVFPAGQSLRINAPDSSGKAKLTLAWKTDDFWDIARTRGLNMLAAVLDDRVRLKIREELGAAYSPRVYSLPSKIDAGFGLLESRLVIAPEQAETVAKALREVAAKLAEEGASEEELKRAQEPTLTAIREQLRHNAYWLNTVLALSDRHPDQLEWPGSIERDFAAMTAADISALAKKYLTPERAAEVLVMPKK